MREEYKTSLEKLGYHGPFLERAGVKVAEMAEVLARPPELPLTDGERVLAYEFENQLFDHRIDDGKSIEDMLRAHKAETTVAPLFFAQAFLEGAVKNNGPEHLPTLTSEIEVYQWIANSVRDKTISPKRLREMAKQSSDLYKAKMAETLISNSVLEPAWQEAQSIVVDSEAFVEAASGIIRTREYLRDLRKEYKEGGDHLEGAKRAIIDVYLARLNDALVSNIPIADYLRIQATLIDDVELATVAHQLVPSSFRDLLDNEDHREGIFRRLDFLRNGMGLDADNKSSAVAYSVESAAGEMGIADEVPQYSAEQTRILKETMIDSTEIQVIMSAILASAGMLSSEPQETWSPMRSGRAADELFQVVENPGAPSFAVDGKTGVYKTASAPRSLYDVLIVGGAHELTHVNQTETDRALGRKFRLAELQGKRITMLRESGANAEQRAAERELFGVSKPVALTYARALQALEQGEGVSEATRVFYDEKRRVMPEVPPQKAAEEASDRVMRLVRQGGINSAPMSYAEDGLFIAELERASPQARKRATAITSFDIVDQVKLHKYGLLAESEENSSIDWMPHIVNVLAPYIQRALNVES